MHHFSKDHVFILPHAREYRKLYGVSTEDILACLNNPEIHEGLATDHYTTEKKIGDHHIYVYYYMLPR